MKRKFLFIALKLMPLAAVNAQDARGRATSTIVADALAQLPAELPATYNQVMAELASTGAEGIEQLALMLSPMAEGVNNSAVEYAVNGVASYVSKDGAAQRDAVRAGLKAAIEKTTDNPNKAFLMTALQICATAEDAEFYAGYLKDQYQGNFAARALAAIHGSEPVVYELMKNQAQNGVSKVLLAQIASYKHHFHDAEPIVISWLQGATPELKTQIYLALGAWGGADAAKVLSAAAKAVGYTFEPTDAYGAYLTLLNGHLMKHEPKLVEKEAKKMMKFQKSNVRLAGLDLLVQMKGAATTPLEVKALADDCREYRYGAMRLSEAYADDNTYAAVAGQLAKAADVAKVDILNWLGAQHAASQIAKVAPYVASSNDDVACAAIAAASKIGGEQALKALVNRLENGEANEVVDAALVKGLLSFNGSINDELVRVMDINSHARAISKQVLTKRRIPAAASKVLVWVDNGGDDSAIPALTTNATEKNFNALCNLFEQGKPMNEAIIKAIQNKPAAEQAKMIQERMAKAGAKKHIYYPVLAATGAKEAVAPIVEGYKSSTGEAQKSAFEGLCALNDASVLPTLLEATANAELKDKAIARYIALTGASNLNNDQKYMNYRKALETNPALKYKNQALSALSATQNYQAMMLASEYMDNAETAQAAANTVLEIATKHPEFYSAEVKALLEKVSATLNDGDAVYKRKDIEKFISENKARESHSIITELSAEEKAEGFELLFDGQNMDAWTGNLEAYQPVDGYMYVTASYGTTGNLYTKKEYADFVLRFEFCFDRDGVNNGVGIRTPMGVDAAYHGMELQVLHHDSPIYKNLKEHQVHGSVYGIIPAKRIKWGALGEWHSEEIRAKGDRITVIVDGQVIVDGNIRKATKGHNVAPDGSDKNPYTVDGRNHPGLFNKKGHIGFLGHGEGIKYRHVRVKEL